MTDTKNAPPSMNPADNDTFAGMFNSILRKFLQNTDDMLPAQIVAYDRAANRAQVQPLIMMVSTTNEQTAHAPSASIPVMQFGGGGMMLNFNLKPGDLGWIKANDRDISLFLQGYQAAAPNTNFFHSFKNAVFIPDVMRGYTINSEDGANAVLSTIDGTQRIAIWPDRVKITSNNLIVIDSPLTQITGRLVTTGTRAAGDAEFTGNVQVDGSIHSDGDTTAGSISLETHVHIDGGGTGDSGPPA